MKQGGKIVIQDSQNMQQADNTRQAQEPRICFYQHALDFINLSATSALLLRGFCKSMCHRCKYLEFHPRHWLEDNLDRKGRGGLVDLDIMRTEMPEFISKDDGFVVSFAAGFIAFVRKNKYVYM
jgi:hypothetical protein